MKAAGPSGGFFFSNPATMSMAGSFLPGSFFYPAVGADLQRG
jgi:hypothetical protein